MATGEMSTRPHPNELRHVRIIKWIEIGLLISSLACIACFFIISAFYSLGFYSTWYIKFLFEGKIFGVTNSRYSQILGDCTINSFKGKLSSIDTCNFENPALYAMCYFASAVGLFFAYDYLKSGIIKGIVNTTIFTTSILMIYEIGLYIRENRWWHMQLTQYQDGHNIFRNVTNADLFYVSLVIFILAMIPVVYDRRRTKSLEKKVSKYLE